MNKNLNILIAEDNYINQKLILKQFNNINFNITCEIVENGELALKSRKENEYDLIFMDINMPIMDGQESTIAILEWEKENNEIHIPIIAVSANVSCNDNKNYTPNGFDDLITKPLNNNEIFDILNKYGNIYKNKTIERKKEQNKERTKQRKEFEDKKNKIIEINRNKERTKQRKKIKIDLEISKEIDIIF